MNVKELHITDDRNVELKVIFNINNMVALIIDDHDDNNDIYYPSVIELDSEDIDVLIEELKQLKETHYGQTS